MIKLSLKQIVDITQGQLDYSVDKNLTIEHISTDTRAIKAGDLFIALKGDKYDAHDFINQASQAKASAVLVEKDVDINIPQIKVADTRKALGLIAAEVKRLAKVKTIAITGSCGKTTVKELCAAICRQVGETHATAGNFNNDIGVPLTLLGLNESHDYAVIELGANHIGEIAYTTDLVKPDTALVNNVSGAHLEGFGSLTGVARAKGEIYSGLSDTGTAIVNLDCDYLGHWQSRLDKLQCLSFSLTKPNADLYAHNIDSESNNGVVFELCYNNENHKVKLQLPGQHNISNALAAAALALAVGVDIKNVVSGLESVKGVSGRLERIELDESLCIINDTYNANLASMKAALDVLASQQENDNKLDSYFVMGDMAEMGEFARSIHQKVGDYARSLNIKHIFTLGELSLHAQKGHDFKNHYSQYDDLMLALSEQLASSRTQQHKACVLVKGSRSAKMERVVEGLIENMKKGECEC